MDNNTQLYLQNNRPDMMVIADREEDVPAVIVTFEADCLQIIGYVDGEMGVDADKIRDIFHEPDFEASAEADIFLEMERDGAIALAKAILSHFGVDD